MGAAKKRGSREERIEQAKQKAQENVKGFPASSPENASSPGRMMQNMALARRLDPLFDKLTTPSQIDEKVIQFARQLSDKAPIFLDCEPEPWSRQSCCDLNVAKYVESHGGRALSGYRIWYAESRYIEGERHAVWTDGANIRDVSFVDTGEKKIVFVPDDRDFDDAPKKVRFAFEQSDKQALVAYESLMALMPVETMPDNQAWDTFPTYEQWSAGKRMPNLMPK